MKYFLRIILAGVSLSCAVGFSSSMFSVSISSLEMGRPSFALQTRNPTASSDEPIKISSFAVYSKKDGKWDYGHAVWEIKTVGDFSISLRSVTYGVVPREFTETVSAKPLAPGVEYQGVGFGPGSTGSIDFIR
ncbi:hypothetical protein [Pseudoduganella aquatica]|uniref:hypothetical protein n=1 Tax=Pseudoduganella aquatica TaxID=2660641 RepID=UPI001E47C572|nr:hypothetical protein [Pseudoduganella aquatica]